MKIECNFVFGDLTENPVSLILLLFIQLEIINFFSCRIFTTRNSSFSMLFKPKWVNKIEIEWDGDT